MHAQARPVRHPVRRQLTWSRQITAHWRGKGASMKQFRSLWLRHRSVPVAAGIVLALGLAGCSSRSSSPGARGGGGAGRGPIKSANILPLSGPTATSGELEQTESTVIENYFNAHDSICGHKIQITNYNDKGDPATSLGIARQLVAQGETIIGQDSLSSPQNEIQPYLMQQHVLVVTNNGAYALLNPQANPSFFSTGPSNAQYAQ